MRSSRQRKRKDRIRGGRPDAQISSERKLIVRGQAAVVQRVDAIVAGSGQAEAVLTGRLAIAMTFHIAIAAF
jgi:uncharacterized protein with PhoU and TrkA domain